VARITTPNDDFAPIAEACHGNRQRRLLPLQPGLDVTPSPHR